VGRGGAGKRELEEGRDEPRAITGRSDLFREAEGEDDILFDRELAFRRRSQRLRGLNDEGCLRAGSSLALHELLGLRFRRA